MLQRGSAHVRIALHPADLGHPITARSLAYWLERWIAERTPTGYAAL
jgi:hypothetical protein